MAPDRFVCESALDEIARRLRFLGYDVATLRGARLEDLFEEARRDGRIVLTTSPRRPRGGGDVRTVVVRTDDAAAAVRAVATGFTAASAPFMRCPRCNSALMRRTSFEAQGEVPGRVLRRQPWFTYCPGCGKWYWDGTHVGRIRAWLEGALGRPLPAGPPSPAPDPPASGSGGAS